MKSQAKKILGSVAMLCFLLLATFMVRQGTSLLSYAQPLTWTDTFDDTTGLSALEMEHVQVRGGQLELSHVVDKGFPVSFAGSIDALTLGQDGKVYGGVWPDAHLFTYDPNADAATDKGTAVTGMMHLWSLPTHSGGTIYGGTGSGTTGHLFTYDTVAGTFIDAGVPISDTTTFMAEKDILALAEGPDHRIYGGTRPSGHLFAYDPVSHTPSDKGVAIEGETEILSLVTGPDGLIYGATGPNAHLFSYNTATGGFSDKGIVVAGEKQVWALTVGHDAKVYGGTSPNGHLFAYDPGTDTIVDKGIPVAGEFIIFDLATGADGRIYGGTGMRGHFFVYDPSTDSLVSSEMAIYGESSVTAVAAGPDGRVYGGTGDTAHLFVYDPLTYQSSGTAVSTIITKTEETAWGTLTYNAATPPGTALTVDVLDSLGNPLLTAVSSGASLASIDRATHPRIKLRANLSTTDPSCTPGLLEWSITTVAAPPVPTPMPTPTPIPRPAPTYEDDFSNPASGWWQGATEDYEKGYVEGEYHILVKNEGGWSVWATAGPWFAHFDAQARARCERAEGVKVYGLLFRYQDSSNFYDFDVDPIFRTYALWKREGGAWSAIVSWTESPAINPGEAPNLLRVICQGSQISLYANGELLATASDDSFSYGRLGLIVTNYTDPDGADVYFDDLTVYGVGERPEFMYRIYLPIVLKSYQ